MFVLHQHCGRVCSMTYRLIFLCLMVGVIGGGLAIVPVLAQTATPPDIIGQAKPLTQSLRDILNFLLGIFGVVALIALVVAGWLYFSAGGDAQRVMLAKRALVMGIAGVVIALGSMVLIWTIAKLLS